MARDIHSEVTARIIAKLAEGVVPWKQPWSAKTGSNVPKNALTLRPYSGVNTLLLWITASDCGYADNRWLTFKQALELKGNVKKGEKSTQIIFVSFIDKINDKGKPENVAFLKSYNVFNVAQVEGIDFDKNISTKQINRDQRDEVIDEFLVATGADIRFGEVRAYYTTAGDYINVPTFESFKGSDHFYSTTFHEVVHWSGAVHRLNRAFGKRFGDQAYSMEELVAELGSGFLCAEFGINNEESNAAYIDHWIKFLSDNPKALTSAASAASKSVEYLRDMILNEQSELEMTA